MALPGHLNLEHLLQANGFDEAVHGINFYPWIAYVTPSRELLGSCLSTTYTYYETLLFQKSTINYVPQLLLHNAGATSFSFYQLSTRPLTHAISLNHLIYLQYFNLLS